jgi:hypothetical protein
LLDLFALEPAQEEIEGCGGMGTLMWCAEEGHAEHRAANGVEVGVDRVRAPPQHLLHDEAAEAVPD